jgi:hypothetical protein
MREDRSWSVDETEDKRAVTRLASLANRQLTPTGFTEMENAGFR